MGIIIIEVIPKGVHLGQLRVKIRSWHFFTKWLDIEKGEMTTMAEYQKRRNDDDPFALPFSKLLVIHILIEYNKLDSKKL